MITTKVSLLRLQLIQSCECVNVLFELVYLYLNLLIYGCSDDKFRRSGVRMYRLGIRPLVTNSSWNVTIFYGSLTVVLYETKRVITLLNYTSHDNNSYNKRQVLWLLFIHNSQTRVKSLSSGHFVYYYCTRTRLVSECKVDKWTGEGILLNLKGS